MSAICSGIVIVAAVLGIFYYVIWAMCATGGGNDAHIEMTHKK